MLESAYNNNPLHNIFLFSDRNCKYWILFLKVFHFIKIKKKIIEFPTDVSRQLEIFYFKKMKTLKNNIQYLKFRLENEKKTSLQCSAIYMNHSLNVGNSRMYAHTV